MIRINWWDPEGSLLQLFSIHNISETLAQEKGFLWMDLAGTDYAESYQILNEIFNFHPLAIEDALDETHIPKIDDWGDYLCLVTRLIAARDVQEGISTQEVDFFIGKNYMITYHQKESPLIDRLWARMENDSRLHARGPAYGLYLFMDEAATEYIDMTNAFDLQLSDLEDRLFDNPDPSALESIFSLKRNILNIQRPITPLREVLNKLARGDYAMLGNDSAVYFRDVNDHFTRLFGILENLRDLSGNTLEIYLSVVNNRMNGVMKALTVITTVFMPISFLAGFFGMNFFAPVEDLGVWTSVPVLWVVLAASILFPIGMIIYFARKGWLS